MGDPDEAGAAVTDGPGEAVPIGMADSDGKADGEAEETGTADGEDVGGS